MSPVCASSRSSRVMDVISGFVQSAQCYLPLESLTKSAEMGEGGKKICLVILSGAPTSKINRKGCQLNLSYL